MRIAIVVSQFNKDISDRLLKGALRALRAAKFLKKNKVPPFGRVHEVASLRLGLINVFEVPGAFEIPWKVQRLIDTKKYSGFIALGAVIHGETDHYKAVCDGVTFGLQKVSIENRIPIMFGVLMCRKEKQALERSQKNPKKNKGYECAKGLLEVLGIRC